MKEKKMTYLPVSTIDKTVEYVYNEFKDGRKTSFSEVVDNALVFYLSNEKRKKKPEGK